MPSLLHEVIVQLFRDKPELIPKLLRESLGMSLPAYDHVRTDSAELTQIAPTEFRADLVALLERGVPVLAVISEIQLSRDPDKPFTWPVYDATLRARLRCDVCLLVVAPDPDVARWARTPIRVGPGHVLEPLVLGPEAIPFLDDEAEARRHPELAVLSVMAHGKDADVGRAARGAMAAITAWLALDDDRSHVYTDVVWTALGSAARTALEALMLERPKYEPQNPLFRQWKAEGIAEGKAEGIAEGKAEGIAEGKAEGIARSVIRVLVARGIELTDDARARILACDDPARLELWIDRAATVSSADELFR